jgi:hypothetical protein
MKKILLLSLLFLSLVSCSKDNGYPPIKLNVAPITILDVPQRFEFGKTYQLTVTYNLANSCFHFFDIDYEYNGTERNIKVLVYENTGAVCTQATVTEKQDIFVKVTQHEDYTFNIWKGKNQYGQDIIGKIVVPVTN